MRPGKFKEIKYNQIFVYYYLSNVQLVPLLSLCWLIIYNLCSCHSTVYKILQSQR